MVAGTRVAAVDLLLCALRVRQHHRARHSDVCTVFDRDPCCRGAAVSRSVVAGVLLKSGGFVDALRNDTRADLLWCGLHDSTYLVVAGTDRVGYDDYYLERCRRRVVEDSATLVTNDNGWILWNTITKETRNQGS